MFRAHSFETPGKWRCLHGKMTAMASWWFTITFAPVTLLTAGLILMSQATTHDAWWVIGCALSSIGGVHLIGGSLAYFCWRRMTFPVRFPNGLVERMTCRELAELAHGTPGRAGDMFGASPAFCRWYLERGKLEDLPPELHDLVRAAARRR